MSDEEALGMKRHTADSKKVEQQDLETDWKGNGKNKFQVFSLC